MSPPRDSIAALRRALTERYAVDHELGAGGMATVYLAEDLKHDRKVALKVLRPELAAVLGAERFVVEIRTTANLQHPHILPLFDSGQADGFLYYVMPLVEGETLRDKLNRETQLSIEEALKITAEVAGALDYAHRRRVIHRDIKPGNILLHDGQAVVTDFGIALALQTAGGDRLTETGLSLGTPQYMSPEQVTAERELDGRSDVYSLAATLYEMLVGRPPFEAATAQAVVAKILSQEPVRVSAERSTVPAHVEAAVHKALAKLPADRFATASQFAQALTDPGALAREITTSRARVEDRGRGIQMRRWHFAALIGVVLLAVTTAVWSWLPLEPGPPPDVIRTVIPLPSDQQPYIHFSSSPVAVSPDGTMLAYTATSGATSRLYLRPLGGFESQAVPGTDGAHSPFFSPDSRRVGFFTAGRLWRVPATGGSPVPICEVTDDRLGAAWGPDETIYFGDIDGLMRVSADGGAPELIRPVRRDSGEQGLGAPQVLRDGRILHSLSRTGPTPGRTEVFDPETDESRIVLVGGFGARYLPSGHLVYSQARVVQVAGFDLERLEVTTSPVPVPDDMYLTILGTPLFSVSDGGTLIYLPNGVAARTDLSAGPGRLVRVTREGGETTLQDDWAGFGRPRLSPDAHRAVDYVPAGASEATSNFHVWVFDLERGTGQPLTTERTNIFPLWTPDSRRVVFSSTQAGQMDLFWAPADGSTPAEPLLIREGEQFASSWSPDGGLLAFYERDPATRMDIWLLRMDDEPEAQPFLQTPANEVDPAFSPDGRWLAYAADASGRYEVYISPFPGPGGGPPVSTEGGRRPHWAPDGRELYYREGDRMWAVSVQTQPALEVGSPELLFEGPYASDFDVDPNGAAFVMVRIDPPTEPSRFHVVLNWFTELDRLVETER